MEVGDNMDSAAAPRPVVDPLTVCLNYGVSSLFTSLNCDFLGLRSILC